VISVAGNRLWMHALLLGTLQPQDRGPALLGVVQGAVSRVMSVPVWGQVVISNVVGLIPGTFPPQLRLQQVWGRFLLYDLRA